MKTAAGFFLEEGSEECQSIQKALTSGRSRCNLMMVRDAEQAAAMLRHECESGAPDVLLVFGGIHDGRAAELLAKIAGDQRLAAIRFPVLVDTQEARRELRQDRATGLSLGDFTLQKLEELLAAAGRDFWWAMARFS